MRGYFMFTEFPAGGRDQPIQPSSRHSPVDIDPQATRSLFVGNIPKNISIYELRDIFQRFGDILVSASSTCTMGYHKCCRSRFYLMPINHSCNGDNSN